MKTNSEIDEFIFFTQSRQESSSKDQKSEKVIDMSEKDKKPLAARRK